MAYPASWPIARSLDDLARSGGVSAVFRAGQTPLGHHWTLHSPAGHLLARTKRVHNGGKIGHAFWNLVELVGMGVGNDRHVELRGADDGVLARASAINPAGAFTAATKPAIVTLTDPAGAQVARSQRDSRALTVYGADDQPVAQVAYDDQNPRPVRAPAGDVAGELLTGVPGQSASPSFAAWILAPDLALNTAAYAQTLPNATQVSFAPRPGFEQSVPLALLPVIFALTY